MSDSMETPNRRRDGHVPSPLQSLSSSTASLGRSPPPGLAMASSPSPHTHRGSFAEQMRGGPGSPRASRQPSLSQQAFQDLINNPPTKAGDPKFHGRDWKTIRLGEIVDPTLVRFVEYDTSVEDATSVWTASQDQQEYTNRHSCSSSLAHPTSSCSARTQAPAMQSAPLTTAI